MRGVPGSGAKHGRYGYSKGCKCSICRSAHAHYNAEIRAQPESRKIDAAPFQRMIYALARAGYSYRVQADYLGIKDAAFGSYLKVSWMQRGTTEQIEDMFGAMIYAEPKGPAVSRVRKWAEARGYRSYAEYADIYTGRLRKARKSNEFCARLDPQVVEDILALEDFTIEASKTERAEVCRQWVARGRTLSELARLSGWRPDRYFKTDGWEPRHHGVMPEDLRARIS